MKTDWTHLDRYRVTTGDWSTRPGERSGIFFIPVTTAVTLNIIATEGDPNNEAGIGDAGRWEHVSVRTVLHAGRPNMRLRIPTWEEMCLVKDHFFTPEECVMQLHPPAADHINDNHYVLHLWRPLDTPIPMPPKICV